MLRARSIMLLVTALVLIGCDKVTTEAPTPATREQAVGIEDPGSPPLRDATTRQWLYGWAEGETYDASVASLTPRPRAVLVFERKNGERVRTLLQWPRGEARCTPESTVSIAIDGYETIHRAVREATPDVCSVQLSDGHLLWLAVAGATELRVAPVAQDGVAATFDVSGLDRDALARPTVMR